SRRYWIRVWRADTLVYSSQLAQIVDLPIDPDKKKFTVTVNVPIEKVDLDQGSSQEVAFRVRSIVISSGQITPGYRIQVALPIEELYDEIIEVSWIIILGLLFSTLILIIISYFLAGRILKPVEQITSLARKIDEKDLAVRIPLGSSHDELYELAFALNQMLDRLHYSFHRQKEFIASAAHELNTPITNVRIFVEQGINNSTLPEPFRNDLVRQNEVLLRMGRLLRSLMILSALEMKRKIHPENFDFRVMVDSVIVDFQSLFELKKNPLKIQMPEHLPYYGDEEQLRRVVVNLIDNAIKYSLSEGTITIELEKINHNIVLKIDNESPPIPENELNKVFEQFYRVEKSRSLEFGGCGLGLTIVREIVNLHGGEIYMENEPSGRVRVVVQLPDINQSSVGSI
ncbi:MAG TPA: HAMP domain-containing histidine kinase, partial [Desulfarculaceae bacterium]|nr:HAMP domain-containing histidine kinase [Desulfarculaceae bacterium]